MGVGLSIAMLASLLVMAAPASAGTLSLSAESDIPKTENNILAAAGLDIVDIAVNGDTIYAATQDNADSILYKSTDGGATWSSLDTSTSYPDTKTIEHVAVAPDNPDVVVASFTDNDVEYSSNGGSSWSDMGQHANLSDIGDIDVSPGATYYVGVVGANSTSGADLFTLKLAIAQSWGQRGGNPGFTANQDKGLAVKFSPNFSTDKIITIVTGNSTSNTAYFQCYREESGARTWNGQISFFDTTDWGTGIDLTDELETITTGPVAASISLADTYLGTDETERLGFIGVAGAANGGAVRVIDSVDKKFETWASGDEGPIGSVAYHESGKLVAGDYDESQAYICLSPMASTPKFERVRSLKQPGGENKTQVGWSGDNLVAGTSGDESAFSTSTDDAVSFNDISLIDTELDVMDDVAVSADGSVVYLTTHDTSEGSGDYDTSVWIKASSWTRVFSKMDFGTDANAAFLVRIAPEDSAAVYVSSKSSTDVWVSKNSGKESWKHVPVYKLDSVVDFEVLSEDTAYAIDADEFSKTSNAGASWGSAKTLDVGTGATLTVADDDTILVGTSDGYVTISTDGGSTFKKCPTQVDAGTAHVVVDKDFADNNVIYVGADDSVKRGKAITESQTWSTRSESYDATTGFGTVPTGYDVTGMVRHGDIIYVLSSDSADSRLSRALELTPTVATGELALWSHVDDNTGLDATPRALKISSSTIKAWAVSSDTNELITLKDPIADAGPTLVAPADNAQIEVNPVTGRAYTITFNWERYNSSKIDEMSLQISTDPDFDARMYNTTFTGIDSNSVAVVVGPNAQYAAEFMPNTTYYWRVRVHRNGTFYSPWSETRSYDVGSATAFTIVSPEVGATDVGLQPTLTWAEYAGAIGYEINVAEDPTFAILDISSNVEGTFYRVTEELEYSTTYYWRVRGVTGVSTSPKTPAPGGDWVTGTFTTMAEPKEPTPPVVIEPTPPPSAPEIVEVPVVTPAPIPAYLLWVIIVIGALLVIALIVLIVRTRRVS
jgi:hypothetical protein